MPCINFNGEIVPADVPLVCSANRGLRYGDGLFETMRWAKNGLVLMQDHFERLLKGLHVLQFQTPEHFTESFFYDQVKTLVEHEVLAEARIRFTVIREGGTMREPGGFMYFVEASKLTVNERDSLENGIKLCVYPDAKKMADILSPLKHNNYLLSCMAAMYAQSHGFDDSIILNQYNRFCETSIANLYFIHGNSVITPPLMEGCVGGVIRKNLLKALPELGFKVSEERIDESIWKGSDAAFVTNSIINMKAVSSIEGFKFNLQPALDLKSLIYQKTELFW